MPLEARLFGSFQLLSSSGYEITITNRRARALLAMLCLAPDETIDRDHLSKLLWPGRFEAQAKASLRQCLLGLGRLLTNSGCDLLEVSRSRICLRADAVQSDLDDLEKALAEGEWARVTRALSSIGGKQILEQMSFGAEFEKWLAERRQAVERRLQTKISDALGLLKASGNLADHNKLLDAWMVRHPASSRAIMADRHSGRTRIAVLPFASQDSEDDQGYFADGIVDELITTLGQVPQLLVAGRTSSFQFKDTDLSLPQIADQLRVTHLVEGSVQRQKADVRMNVRLIDGQTGFESWSYGYSGTEDDIFSSREQLARTITSELGAALKLQISEPSVRPMTDNKQAYGLYLQGRALTRRAIGDGVLETAIRLLEQALELEPEFAECWTALAEAHVYTAVYTPCLDRIGQSTKAAVCARRAIELSPGQGHARAMLAIHQWTQNDIVGALDLAFEAYRLEPENPDVVMRLGSFLLYCGRCTDALPYIEAAIEQDPVHGRNYVMLSMVHLNLGNLEAAINAGQRIVDLGFPSLWLAVATAAAGDHERAVEQYRQTRLLMNTVIFPPVGTAPMSPEALDTYWLIAAKGVCSGHEADRAQYCQVLDMLYFSMADKYDSSIVFPAICMGHTDMLYKTLGEQITPQNFVPFGMLWNEMEPTRNNRAHPGFMDFAKRIGMVAAWEKYGWPDRLEAPVAHK